MLPNRENIIAMLAIYFKLTYDKYVCFETMGVGRKGRRKKHFFL